MKDSNQRHLRSLRRSLCLPIAPNINFGIASFQLGVILGLGRADRELGSASTEEGASSEEQMRKNDLANCGFLVVLGSLFLQVFQTPNSLGAEDNLRVGIQ